MNSMATHGTTTRMMQKGDIGSYDDPFGDVYRHAYCDACDLYDNHDVCCSHDHNFYDHHDDRNPGVMSPHGEQSDCLGAHHSASRCGYHASHDGLTGVWHVAHRY